MSSILMSQVSMITICYMTISNIMVVIGESDNDWSSTISQCYDDIAQTMTDKDSNCNPEMETISKLIDDTFEYCAFMEPVKPQQCYDKTTYLSMMTDTSMFCGTYDAVTFYLKFIETNTNDEYQIVDVQEYSKPKSDNCVHILYEEVKVEYASDLVHTVTETKKDDETKICNLQYENLKKISESELSSFTLTTSINNIDNARIGILMLDNKIRGLQDGWDINSKPNSPQLIDDAYMIQNGNDITFGGKVGYVDDSSFIYVQFDA